MGHVMRCLSLARELARLTDVEPIFVMRDFASGIRWVERQPYEVVVLPADLAPEEEAGRLRTLIDARRAHGVITDLRQLPPGVPEAVMAAGALCVTIDEWGRRAITTDILTNGTIVPAWHHYELQGAVQCYIGPRYTVLDPQFAAVHQAPRPPRAGSPTVLIALGGDDPFRLTVKAMRALERIAATLAVTVVVGPAFLDEREIVEAAARSRHRYTVRRNVSDMAALMVQSDVALTGGGLIALELACTGTPGFILCEVSHQLETAAVLEQQGATVSLGFGVAVPEEEMAREVQGLLEDGARRRRMSVAGKRLLDGKGCRRIAEAILGALAARGVVDEQHATSVPAGR